MYQENTPALQVSFDGSPLRRFETGAVPRSLLWFDGRLYLIECATKSGAGKRIMVLSPEGDTLEVYRPRHIIDTGDEEGDDVLLTSLAAFDDKLVVTALQRGVDRIHHRLCDRRLPPERGLFALTLI
jgi:hypothetical protein